MTVIAPLVALSRCNGLRPPTAIGVNAAPSHWLAKIVTRRNRCRIRKVTGGARDRIAFLGLQTAFRLVECKRPKSDREEEFSHTSNGANKLPEAIRGRFARRRFPCACNGLNAHPTQSTADCTNTHVPGPLNSLYALMVAERGKRPVILDAIRRRPTRRRGVPLVSPAIVSDGPERSCGQVR